MSTKDLFSGHAELYAAFRPTYPEDLYQFIFSHLNGRTAAWDCATGNGQVARRLAAHFKLVCATDISSSQISKAFRAENISYSIAPAESTTFVDDQFDLITIAQALHWINTDDFYREVVRTGKPGSLLAVWGYGLLETGPEVDTIIQKFYRSTVGPYWDSARKHIDDAYQRIPFPFTEYKAPALAISVQWSLDHLAGYLASWSATQKFIEVTGDNPVPPLIADIGKHWEQGSVRTVNFPIFIKLGRIP